LRQSDEPLTEHVVEEFAKETELCARERVDVAMRRCLVILDVNFMITLAMRGHVLSLFSREHIEKVLVGLRDDFGEELCLVGGKGLRVQSGHWSRLVADGLQGRDVQIITSQLDIMVYTSSPALISRLKAAAPIRLIEGGFHDPFLILSPQSY